MLSSQIDALRRAAQNYRDFGKYEAEQMMLDAADTIWRLRDDLQRANAENAKLRELVRDMCEWAYIDSYCELQDEFADRMRELGVDG